MAKTTADVPPSVANEYSRASRPHAVAEADGDGYTKTRKMADAQKPGKSRQYGLPIEGSKSKPLTKKNMPGC